MAASRLQAGAPVVRSIACVLIVAAALAGAATADTFRRANGNDPDTLDPQKYELLSEGIILRDLFEGLTTQDADNRIVPGQAESWTASPDGLTWTFTLREGLVWSDGAPLTAEDFVAGMRRAADPKTGAKIPEVTYKLKNARAILAGTMPVEALGVAAPDARTVVLTLEAPSPLIPTILAHAVLAPVPRHVIAAHGEDWIKPGLMVTNGPYVLASWEPSDKVRIVKNPRFRDAASVAMDEVVFFPSDDMEMALKRFRAGELDLVPQLPPTKIAWARKEAAEALALTPVAQLRYLEINHTLAKFQDVRVRRALALAIDRETIAGPISGGSVIAAYGIVPRTLEGYEGALFDFAGTAQAERAAAAKALLAEAGYGPDNPLTLELRVMSDAWAKPLSAAIVSMWGKAGIKASVLAAEAKVHYAAVGEGQFEVALSGWFGGDDPETFMWLFQTGGGLNESGYSNAAFDAASARAETAMELGERYRLFAEAERMLLEDVATVPLFWTIQASLISPRIDGFKPTPRGLPRSRYARPLG